MKSCPKCQRVFPTEAAFCPADGTPLAASSGVPAAPSVEDARIGSKLVGRYEIRRIVADGGMGRVYEGIDKETRSRVAVKVLHDEVAKDEIARERFKREYDISSLLPHEHIVKVLDFQRDMVSSTWLLVMEFLDGEELRFALKREKTLPPERIVRIFSQAAIALDEAHGRKLVHRDLKPDNLFLCGTRDGDEVKILDFGSVKDTSDESQLKKLTVLGTTIGSPYYMAPEQAQGLETIDRRADVFALTAVLYECLTGSVPFIGNNGPAILFAIMTKDPEAPSARARGSKHRVPRAMDDVVERGLAKNPDIRTPTVGALADALGRAYGLEGDHLQWASTPQQELGTRIAAASSASQGPQALQVVADPFAPSSPSRRGGAREMDEAFGAVREADLRPPGVPAGKPAWLLPFVVGLLALVVGGAVTLAVMAR